MKVGKAAHAKQANLDLILIDKNILFYLAT